MANVSADIGRLQAAQGVASPADLNVTEIDDLTPLCELVFVAGARPCLIYLSSMGNCHILAMFRIYFEFKTKIDKMNNSLSPGYFVK